MARHEKRVAAQFEEKRVCTFLPLLRQIHQWSDRRSMVEVPMFSCYAFVRIAQTTEERLKVLRTPGVLGFVGSERQGTPIPEEQIESLQDSDPARTFRVSRMLSSAPGGACAFAEDRWTASREFSCGKARIKAWSYRWNCCIDPSRFESKGMTSSWFRLFSNSESIETRNAISPQLRNRDRLGRRIRNEYFETPP